MNSDVFTTFVIGLAGVGVAGFVAWTIGMIIKLRSEMAAFRLHVSEAYIKRDDLNELKSDVKNLTRVIFSIAGKLGITVRNDDGT